MSRVWKTRIFVGGALVVVVLSAVPGTALAAHVPSGRGMSSASNDGAPMLVDVSALTPSDAWAVGYTYPGFHAVLRHWDGSTWSRVVVPHPGQESALWGVDAYAADDVWVVGDVDRAGVDTDLILHWDGSTWTRVPNPGGPTNGQPLSSVSADASDDAWAVGGATVEHWDGHSWQLVGLPALTTVNDVHALSPSDAWIVGTHNGHPIRTATFHWDGTALTRVDSIDGTTRYNILNGVDASSTTDVWSVGAIETGDGAPTNRQAQPALTGGEHPLIEHWDGQAWSRVYVRPQIKNLVLSSVTVESATDVWAAGNIDYFQPQILHWDGARWKVAQTPASSGLRGIHSVSADSPTDAWAVGATYDGTGAPTGALIWHWDGSQWTD